jgi:hypothetical protein
MGHQLTQHCCLTLLQPCLIAASWQIQLWKYKSNDPFTKFNELWVFLEALDSKLNVLEDALQHVEQIIN